MTDNFSISIRNRNKVLNYFLNIVAIEIANNYITFLEKNNETIPESILNFLDQSIYLTREKIRIDKINPKIKIMSKEETINIENILKKNDKCINQIYEIIIKIKFLLCIIKEEELQKILFSVIYNDFLKNKNIKKQIKKQKSIIDNFIQKLSIPNNPTYNYRYQY